MNEGAGTGPKTLRPCPALYEIEMMLTTRSKAVQDNVRRLPQVMAAQKAMRRFRNDPYRPFSAVMPDGAWAGEPCFVIGGGPSLIGFDFERLRGRGRIIVVNRAYEFCQFADVLFFMDNRFYLLAHKDPEKRRLWEAFAGHKVFLNIMGRKYEDTYSVKAAGRIGLSNSLARGLYHGNNSGVGAVNLAFCLKAKPIYLLGFDFKFAGKVSHFHGGYGIGQHEGVVRSFARDFERLYRFTSKTSARIVNLNPNSGLRVYPFSTLDEVLNDRPERQSVGYDGPALCEPVCASTLA